jgi:SAM-dependent methyltransferase
MASELPIPPPDLASRVGGSYQEYRAIGAAHRGFIASLLPEDWSFSNKRVLDFGCGPGRTLTAHAAEAESAEFWGCDIDAPSIEWAQSHLSPPFHFFVCDEVPPLDQPDSTFDLVYAMSVFTHITDHWNSWIAELHRVMRPEGVAIISILGPAMANAILGRDWDDRIGMAVADLHKGWEIGGPSVFHSEWWIREHWGRAFEILRFEPHQTPGAGHDFVTMRRRDVEVTAGELNEVSPEDGREHEATIANLELLRYQLIHFGAQARLQNEEIGARQLEHDAEREHLITERDQLTQELAAARADRSRPTWRRRIAELSRR